MMRGSVAAVLVLCAGVSACSDGSDHVAGDYSLTSGAIAAITQEHTGLEPKRVAEWIVFTRELGSESPGARMEYAELSLAVVVAPTSDSPLVCAVPTFFDECVAESLDGHDVTIAWQDLEPEEDPGVVYVIDRRREEDVAVQVIGASITDDPRDLDLGVPLADLAALATDPRLSLTTSREVVELGVDIKVKPA